MERRGFLKSILALTATSLIPTDNILAATDFVEKKSNLPNKFVNHMTIQRKTYRVTGSAQSKIEWHETDFTGATPYYYKLNYSE